jgi:predicted patatin/cPLA2 family phospholipase
MLYNKIMHTVIKNILARKNLDVPVNDGRKITLVLFGGIMISVRGAGALTELDRLGLTHAFDEIYSMSSGFINASYFLADQMTIGTRAYYEDLSGLKFINPFRFWKFANIRYLMKVVQEIKPLNIKKILESKSKLYTMVTNNSKKENYEFLEVHKFSIEQYWDLLKACSSLKYLAGGSTQIGIDMYNDVYYDEALCDFLTHILATDATDILIIYNYPWQQTHIHERFPNLDKNRIFEICTSRDSKKPTWLQKLGRFETRPGILKSNAEEMTKVVRKIFS